MRKSLINHGYEITICCNELYKYHGFKYTCTLTVDVHWGIFFVYLNVRWIKKNILKKVNKIHNTLPNKNSNF